ncbi:hypothetical protein TNCV_1088321 [Trichonephila clavipes]|uniref:Uncharacterized protein n=1 Tax=Trichonephila clavipes TaxID=2585209 RepID=A0A8X6SRQ2_TRICX|nr:hypothetical protein TNCV_1088321 [Trichonephila clavipes]
MHFAIEWLFYEENREMFLIPEKNSLYTRRRIRNIEPCSPRIIVDLLIWPPRAVEIEKALHDGFSVESGFHDRNEAVDWFTNMTTWLTQLHTILETL